MQKEKLRAFENYLTYIQKVRPETRKTYTITVRQFLRLIEKEPDKPITENDLKTWNTFCVDKYSDKSKVPKYSAVKQYINYLIDEKKILDDSWERKTKRILKSPRSTGLRQQTNIDKLVLQPKEYQKIFETAKSRNKMHYTLFTTMFSIQARRFEACGLWIEDIDFKAKKVHFRPENAKGGKEAWVSITQECLDIIQDYKDNYRGTPEPGEEKFLFLRDGWRLSKTKMFEIHKEYQTLTEIELHPHKWRHTGCTEYAKREKDVKKVQTQCRHENPETTMKYINYTSQDLEKSYHEKFPSINAKPEVPTPPQKEPQPAPQLTPKEYKEFLEWKRNKEMMYQ